MYNTLLIGKNLSGAEAYLKQRGIEIISVVSNDTKYEYRHDCELVVKAEIADGKAKLYTSKFLLKV